MDSAGHAACASRISPDVGKRGYIHVMLAERADSKEGKALPTDIYKTPEAVMEAIWAIGYNPFVSLYPDRLTEVFGSDPSLRLRCLANHVIFPRGRFLRCNFLRRRMVREHKLPSLASLLHGYFAVLPANTPQAETTLKALRADAARQGCFEICITRTLD